MSDKKERPILFSAPMVRALLDGSKTQTRRVVKGMALDWLDNVKFTPEYVSDCDNNMCPYGKVGDRIWVREAFAYGLCTESSFAYKATHKPSDLEEGWSDPIKWNPSIHMPRWASRINLEITAVRVERLNDISEADAKAEGAPSYEEGIDAPPPVDGDYAWSYVASFQKLWESINGDGSWQANPWVWVFEFRVMK